MSESVERRVLELLDNPTISPYGNPIPGLDELVPGAGGEPLDASAMAPLSDVAQVEVRRVIVRRIAEPLQDDGAAMTTMHRIGAMPGASVKVHRSAGGVTIGSAGEYTELANDIAAHVLVETAG
jgi:DtxR family transcriptional regulator, Mn-dependent transcriptional regulator